MKRSPLLLLLFAANMAFAQAPTCSTFEGPTLDGWSVVNGTAKIVSSGGRRYVDVCDGPGATNFVAPPSYAHYWLRHTYGCGSICFDVAVINDGLPTSVASRPYFVIADAAGHSASFQANGIVEGTGWQTVCAPIGPLVNDAPPANGEGKWSYGPNTTGADWTSLLEGVQSFRMAIDFTGSSALSERLLFDNICFRPQTCFTQPASASADHAPQFAPNVTNWKGCPKECLTVIHEAGVPYNHCTWVRHEPSKHKGVMQYIPGTQSTRTCSYGTPLDVEKRHRLFVHGLHSDHWAWNMWILRVKEQMDYLKMKTIADDTGALPFFGPGTGSLLSQVAQLAKQINAGFAGVDDGSVWVYAHSLGSLKVEALLQFGYIAGVQCNFGSTCSDPYYLAAKKIGTVYVFQGAHGGCKATAKNGDRPNHGPLGCPASGDIGTVADGSPNIPGTSLRWNMLNIVWKGRGAAEKKITYVVAISLPRKERCAGASGLICNDVGGLHDGVVYATQMSPKYDFIIDAVNAGNVRVVQESDYCHMSDDTYPPPRLSNDMMEKYVGLVGTDYITYSGVWQTFTPITEIATCDARCFCIRDRPMACSQKIECSQFEPPPRVPCVDLGSTGDTVGGPAWIAAQPIVPWTRCAEEGGTCSMTGVRLVRYGGNGRYALRMVATSTPCTNAIFGDPAPGVAKACEYQDEPVVASTLAVP